MKRRPRKIKTKKKRTFKLSEEKWRNGLLIAAVALAIVRFVIVPLATRGPRPSHLSRAESVRVSMVVDDVLSDFYIRDNWRFKKRDYVEIHIPEKFKFVNFYVELNKKLEAIGIRVIECSENPVQTKITMTLGSGKKTADKIVFIRKSNLPSTAGVAAIIIDDFGYSYNDVTQEFLFMREPITISIIPGLPNTERVVRQAQLAQKEILIHMPMEPLNEDYDDHGYTILCNQDPGIIRLRIQKAISEIPVAAGINNHQGSKATADRKVMNVALREIKRNHLFFIDSRTNSKSVALDVAKKIHLASAANQMFIDAREDEDFMKMQMKRLADMANKKGRVIGIAHVRKKTLQVLKKMLPELETHGVRLVPVSKLVR
ncbi:MAG: divergent polysaccharide deacetylase family protein [Calditrichaeota bacterium]|nr:divergent polysaccharide deacetylase family protein [Calditrichota bacterium]